MRFLADENIPVPVVRLLRAEGLEVEAVAELTPCIPDEQVLSHARAQGQVIITFDRDFGELVYHRGAPVPAGVVYLRLPQGDVNSVAQTILELTRLPEIQVEGRFTVVDSDKVRERPLLQLD